jgi:hypothetical protein
MYNFYFPSKLIQLTSVISFLLFSAFSLQASDTIHVRVHDKVDMVWFESYDREGVFPSEDQSFHKIWMVATLGCASGGCSDWDYTVNFHLLHEAGLDSVISDIDTLSGGELDTIWSVNPIREEFEIGRLITPYGGFMANGTQGFNNNWTHSYRYDITDFAHMLRDTTTIRAFYAGWSAGFSITLDFYFIEGTPPREVLEVKNIVHGSHNYDDAETYNEVRTPAVSHTTPSGTVQSKLRYLPSGHGFDNNVFCAEFCPRQYFLSIDGNQVGSGLIWKDDCGQNPLYPQGGTWVYDRANWCPGESVPLHEFELGDMLSPGAEHSFNLELEDYNWSGDQTPSYITSYQVVYYGDWNIGRDAELLEIIAPSQHEDHLRMNPICGSPIVKVRNIGGEDLSEITFEYGFPGGSICTYTWNGQLSYSEEATIELPAPLWNTMDEDRPKFFVRIIEVDGQPDEVEYNNELRSAIDIPTTMPETFVINFNTHSRFDDFTYGIYREDGSKVFERVPSASSSLFSDTINLDIGCYYFRVWDDQGFGLANWPTGQGNGSIQFRRSIGNFWTTIRSIPPDFGSESTLHFTVGYELPEEPMRSECGALVTQAGELFPGEKPEITIFPNPATTSTLIKSSADDPIVEISVTGTRGELVLRKGNISSDQFNLDTSPLRPGIYFVKISSHKQTVLKKLIVIE